MAAPPDIERPLRELFVEQCAAADDRAWTSKRLRAVLDRALELVRAELEPEATAFEVTLPTRLAEQRQVDLDAIVRRARTEIGRRQ